MATTMTPPHTTHGVSGGSLLPGKLARSRPLLDPEIIRRALRESFVKLNPITLAKNPVMFVVEVGAALTTVFLVRDVITGGAGSRIHNPDCAVAMVHGPVRQLRRSHGGGARQGAGRHAAQDQDATRSPNASDRDGNIEQVPASKLRAGDIVIAKPAT